MKMSLLDIVQATLSDMNSDDVNSISDTVEAEQIAAIVRDTYHEMVTTRDYLDLNKYIQLEAATDNKFPTLMKLPKQVLEVKEIRYKGHVVKHLNRKDFMSVVGSRANNEAITIMQEPKAHIDLYIINNYRPMYWTSFDDEHIIFDGWESKESETLLSKDVAVYAEMLPEWSMTDSFVPPLPLRAYPLLLAETKSKAFSDIKQMPSAKEEQKARRMKQYMSRKKNTTHNGIRYPDYGRK
jgi:hypothetical protein